MNIWYKTQEKICPPGEGKWLVWLVIPPLFLGVSAILAKMYGASVCPVAFALVIQIFYVMTGKKNLFLLGVLGWLGTAIYLGLGDLWNVGYLGTILLSLFLSYEITGQARLIFQGKESQQKELERDVDLWKTRFETLHEKITSDKEVVEGEIEKLEQVIEARKKEIESLRVLIALSHKETRRAEEMLGSQQEALKHRQTINESLQVKRTAKPAISLKDLAKKI
jgi:hypothetical protein